jgi:hypothetical protein
LPKLRKGLNTKWKITLPTYMAGRVELILMDKMSGRPVYGARSELIRRLLEQWLADGSPIPNPDLAELSDG